GRRRRGRGIHVRQESRSILTHFAPPLTTTASGGQYYFFASFAGGTPARSPPWSHGSGLAPIPLNSRPLPHLDPVRGAATSALRSPSIGVAPIQLLPKRTLAQRLLSNLLLFRVFLSTVNRTVCFDGLGGPGLRSGRP